MLGQSLPGVRVSAEHYPPSTAAMAASAFVSGVRWLVLLAAIGGDKAVEVAAGLEITPLTEFVQVVQQNKMAFGGGAWFLGSSLSQSLLKSGAFEVLIRGGGGEEEGDINVWSGLKRGGRPPQTYDEMNAIIDSLKMAGVGRSSRRRQVEPVYEPPDEEVADPLL